MSLSDVVKTRARFLVDFFNRQRVSIHSNRRHRTKKRGETPPQQLEMQTYLGGEEEDQVDAFHRRVLLSSSSSSDDDGGLALSDGLSDEEDDTFAIDKSTGEWRGVSVGGGALRTKKEKRSSLLAWFRKPGGFSLNRSDDRVKGLSEEARVLLLDEDDSSESSDDENSHFRIG